MCHFVLSAKCVGEEVCLFLIAPVEIPFTYNCVPANLCRTKMSFYADDVLFYRTIKNRVKQGGTLRLS